ncbi:MAG: hypothetical protein KIT84_23225 [Labilithrix sp.]|nr:hypothetical protein [Labilithrix sp.]MCW5813959.1 hypothetical protein [Labilithrix sp.]
MLSACTRSRPSAPASERPVDDPRFDFRPTPWTPFSPVFDTPPRAVAFDALCADDVERCRAECSARDTIEFASCALELRYGDDAASLELARSLFDGSGVVVGVETSPTVEAGHLGELPISPAPPVGPYRRHLEWVVESFRSVEDTFAALAAKAPRPMMFRTRPYALRFYKTESRSFPSAWAIDGVVAYNVEGPLFQGRDGVAATLFHELFHLNDQGHGFWSVRALVDTYAAIRTQCGNDDACLAPYAPDETRVEGGTFYAFDERVDDVREYAADVALRWFREHEAALRGEPPEAPFRCATPENLTTWTLLVEEFFGATDLLPPCEEQS